MDASEAKEKIDSLLSRNMVLFLVTYAGETERDESWKCDHWRVEFHRTPMAGDKAMKPQTYRTDYYTGLGLRSKHAKFIDAKPQAPRAADVLYSLLSDATAEQQSFSDWCSDLGKDTDSIKALNTYSQCCEASKNLYRIFSAAHIVEMREILQDY